MSQLLALAAETLKDLDHGKAGIAFNRLVEQAVKDCINRPTDDRQRVITLKLSLVPVKEIIDETQISCEGAKGTYKVALAIPPFESQTLDFGVRENGLLIFNADSPADHRQATMDFDEEEHAK